MKHAYRQSGITLVEVVVAISIVTAMVVAVGFSVISYVNARAELVHETKALYLAEEGYELLRTLRDDDWNDFASLALNTTHYFDVATTSIAVTGTPEVIDGAFRRSFELQSVYRDNDDDIASSSASGATIDPETISATVYVAGPTGTTSVEAILTNLHAI